jgi:hypothetical protein
MWFKVFVLLRLPISVIALLGYAALDRFGDSPSMGCFIFLCAYAFLVVVSVKLIRRRPMALQLAACLLALEIVGMGLWVNAAAIAAGRLELLSRFAVVWVALWVLPNALVLYSQRGKFPEPETKKPCL